MDPKRKQKPTIQQLVGPRMKLPLSSHTHLHQPPATEGASLEGKGNEWRVIHKYFTGKIPSLKTHSKIVCFKDSEIPLKKILLFWH